MNKLNEAIKIAIKGKVKKKHHYLGCIAQREDGSFVYSTNSRAINKSPSVHAEIKVLKKAGKNCILWIARVMADGSWGMAKPCENCQKLIKKYKVKRVYYTIGENKYGKWINK